MSVFFFLNGMNVTSMQRRVRKGSEGCWEAGGGGWGGGTLGCWRA